MVAFVSFLFAGLLGYKVVALVLLLTVSVLAMLFDILPVLMAAVLSALIWNLFFIPPLYTLHIYNAEDLLMFLMYFVIAFVNAVLTFKIREAEKQARDKEEKENTIKLYNTLLNSLSHEMRTPLAAIIGACDTLKENNTNLSAENKEHLINEISYAGMRLNRQVENLLNMSRLETGMLQPNKDWCDVNELIFGVMQKFTAANAHHSILFEPNETLPLFKLDAGLLETVLHNLIHNAIYYTPQGTRIQLTANYLHDTLHITVSDNGPGFPEGEIPLVFNKFYRLPQSKAGGTGLGLSIVKGFVEAQQGKVGLQNNTDGGACFTIQIPAETSFINNLKND